MKKKQGLVLRTLGSENMIVAESLDLIDFDRIVSLNESAAYIWESLPEEGFEVDDIIALLRERYEVSLETATKDAGELVDIWLKGEIIENGI